MPEPYIDNMKQSKNKLKFSVSNFTIIVDRGGIVIEHRTPEREVGDSTYKHRVCVLDLDTLRWNHTFTELRY